jgi:predicted short-subunit dehydrogenase-like oxidoreductase (DUF2520 family)
MARTKQWPLMSTPGILNIIGCGKLGKVLGRLWAERDTFTVQQVLNRSIASALDATAFMGAGQPADGYAELRPADVWLIGTSDDQIEAACVQLVRTEKLRAGDIVFHCSGALPSAMLRSVLPLGVGVASIHPIRSFAEPAAALETFAGCYCGTEGEAPALDLLIPAFTAIGAHPVPIDPEFKSLYHSAAVFASNYLVTVLDVAISAYEKAGIPQDVASRMLEPLVRGTMDNIFRSSTTAALTGPVARGDMATVRRQFEAVHDWDADAGTLYEQLAKLTGKIARRKNALRS